MSDRVVRKLPPPLRAIVERVRGDDTLLFAAALAFYAMVSIVPLTILMMWFVSIVLGDARTQQFAQEVGRLAPKDLGIDRLLTQVADLGTRIGLVALITGLWPATAYGAGLRRAFDRLSPTRETEMEGLRGRGLFFLILLPVFVMGSLVGSFAGTAVLGKSTPEQVAGSIVALATGFLGASAGLVLIYRFFPPHEHLGWRAILKATAGVAGAISLLSLLFMLYLNLGANFQDHYATSGVAGLVLLAVWLFLSNAMVLAGYKVALEVDSRGGSVSSPTRHRSKSGSNGRSSGPSGSRSRSSASPRSRSKPAAKSGSGSR
jgi:membrane protein